MVLLHGQAGPVATLTLNRPAARNALSVELMTALEDALACAAEDQAIRAVVIDAAGPAFCAGHDLREMRAPGTDHAALFAQCSRLMMAIVRHPKPVIASVHGIATAAGCQLVASADLAIAAETAKFATPGVDIGLFCSTPAVALARAVPRKAALDMLLTGEPIQAARALALGLVSRVVPDAALAAETRALATLIASKSPHVIALGKRVFHQQAERGLSDAYTLAADAMVRNMGLHDASEGIDAFIHRRPPAWARD